MPDLHSGYWRLLKARPDPSVNLPRSEVTLATQKHATLFRGKFSHLSLRKSLKEYLIK